MSPHVPGVNGRSQLSWMFFVAIDQLERARERAAKLTDLDDHVSICSALDNLALAFRTLEVMADNFEAALAGVLGAVVAEDGLQEHHVDALLAPMKAQLGEWYVDGTLAALAAHGRRG